MPLCAAIHQLSRAHSFFNLYTPFDSVFIGKNDEYSAALFDLSFDIFEDGTKVFIFIRLHNHCLRVLLTLFCVEYLFDESRRHICAMFETVFFHEGHLLRC